MVYSGGDTCCCEGGEAEFCGSGLDCWGEFVDVVADDTEADVAGVFFDDYVNLILEGGYFFVERFALGGSLRLLRRG